MKKLSTAIAVYRYVTHWNGESVSELYEHLRSALFTLPFVLVRPLTFALRKLRGNRGLRFDLSDVSEPILAVDRTGYALVGNLPGLRVVQLTVLDTADRTYTIAPDTVRLRTRRASERWYRD